MILIILFVVIILLLYILIACIIGTIKKNWGTMDIFYGIGYFIVAFSSLYLTYKYNGYITIQQLVVILLVSLWAIRLAIYVFIRNRGKPEDRRYAFMRKRWKEKGKNIFLKSFTNIYLFQGLVIFIVAFPIIWININKNPPITSLLDFVGITLLIGVFIWIVGFYFESIGDYQLYKFLKNHSRTNKVMDKGLWKYSQHPNYFGEVCMWWGIYIIVLATPWGFLTIFGPIYITFQIINISGVKLFNKIHENDEEFMEYRKKTSTFIPWMPKKKN